MTNEFAEIGGFLFAKAKTVFEFSDALDSFVTQIENAISDGIDGGIEKYDDRIAWLKEKVCTDIKDIENKLSGNEVLSKLELAFEHSEIGADLENVIDMEKGLIERSGYKGTGVADSSIDKMLSSFKDSLLQLEGDNEDGPQSTGPLKPFRFKQASKALKSLSRARYVLCSPEQVIVDKNQRINHIKALARMGRHVGVLTADAAGFCCGFTDMTALLLFTSAKSVVTSTHGITNEINTLKGLETGQIKPSDNGDAEGYVSGMNMAVFNRQKQRIKDLNKGKPQPFGNNKNDSKSDTGD